MIETLMKHYKSDFDDSNVKVFFKPCLKNIDNGFFLYSLPRSTRDGVDIQVGFNKSYASLIENINYEQPFSQAQMFEICSTLFNIMFNFRLFTSGTGFESRFKTPERMSQKLSSFWYDRHLNTMTVPAEIYEDHINDRISKPIPVSLSYDIIFNEQLAGIQNTFRTPTRVSSGFDGVQRHQELVINFRNIDNVFTYNVSILSTDENEKQITLFKTTKTFEHFDEFLLELSNVLKRELFNINYKDKYEAFTNTPIDFENFDVDSINTLFDMMKI